MAQWIPKTAWKLSNLNKVYGVGEIGLHVQGAGAAGPYRQGVAAPVPFHAQAYYPVPHVGAVADSNAVTTTAAAGSIDQEQLAMLKRAYEAHVPFIDVRDEHEIAQKALKHALQLHHHDLLSGACNHILPRDRRRARLVVFSSSQQRSVNAYRALRRWGFQSVVIADAAAVLNLDDM